MSERRFPSLGVHRRKPVASPAVPASAPPPPPPVPVPVPAPAPTSASASASASTPASGFSLPPAAASSSFSSSPPPPPPPPLKQQGYPVNHGYAPAASPSPPNSIMASPVPSPAPMKMMYGPQHSMTSPARPPTTHAPLPLRSSSSAYALGAGVPGSPPLQTMPPAPVPAKAIPPRTASVPPPAAPVSYRPSPPPGLGGVGGMPCPGPARTMSRPRMGLAIPPPPNGHASPPMVPPGVPPPKPPVGMVSRTPSGPSRQPSSRTSSLVGYATQPSLHQVMHSGSASPSSVAPGGVRRSSSTTSTITRLGGYVSLLRKQKATVWCDRSQKEDPRITAQRKAAKMRATHAIHSSRGSLGTHPKSGMSGSLAYGTGTLVGVSAPIRLLANEVDDENHERANSGLSSGSKGPGSYRRPPQSRLSSAVTPDDAAVANSQPPGPPLPPEPAEPKPKEEETKEVRPSSANSYQGKEELDTVPDMKGPVTQPKTTSAADLKRTGSVDDRKATMTNVRLFVANPDS